MCANAPAIHRRFILKQVQTGNSLSAKFQKMEFKIQIGTFQIRNPKSKIRNRKSKITLPSRLVDHSLVKPYVFIVFIGLGHFYPFLCGGYSGGFITHPEPDTGLP